MIFNFLKVAWLYSKTCAKQQSFSLDKGKFWDATVGAMEKKIHGQMLEFANTVVAELRMIKTEAKEYRSEIIRFLKEQKRGGGQA